MTINLNEIESVVAGVLAQEAVELVDLRYLRDGGRWVLRFFVDKQGGVTIDDCERVSRRLGAILDAAGVMTHAYALEVSSPGLKRIIKKIEDYERFSGERVKLSVHAAVSGQRHFRGILRGVEDGKILLEHDGGLTHFAPTSIHEARLDPEIRI
ncbi:MAG: ribosome maturation factor RimP [Elusimicrobiota bacterium]